MSGLVIHPKCGKRFASGDRTGHCAACCETFYGLAAFDQHLIRADHRVSCSVPTADGGEWHLDSAGRWHIGEPMSAAAVARLRGAA
ncbi:hypothetical protein OOZ51_05000 [Arthrobacter sp. MI7-26]|nr:hypothetical protein [Arthrobacter sp. MI7-26]